MEDRHRIILPHRIKYIANQIRKNEETIATTNGCFDIIHPGHLYSIHEARKKADRLIVCINCDESVRRLKGENRPFFGEYDRAKMLCSLRDVDYVTIFKEDDPRKILSEIKPDFHIKSKHGYKGIEEQVIKNNGGKIVLVEDYNEVSSTDIIDYLTESIKNMFETGGLWSG